MSDNKIPFGQGRKLNSAKPTETKTEVEKKLVTQQEFTLAGVTHTKYPFEDLEVGQPVTLIRDSYGEVVYPEKGHPDPTAVAVFDSSQRHIGYIKAAVAKVIFRVLQEELYSYEGFVSEVKGGYKAATGEQLHWGVDIVIKFYRK